MFILLFLLLISCTSTPSYAAIKPDDITDMASMDFYAEGILYDGVATLPDQKEYILNFKLPEKTIMLGINNCHGEVFNLPTDKQTAVTYRYQPLGIEREGDCPLIATAITSTGQKIWAMIEFIFVTPKPLPQETYKAWAYCNRKIIPSIGGYLCQSRAGKWQRVAFDTEVVYIDIGDKRCNAPVKKNLTMYDIKLSNGQCSYTFFNKASQVFRFNTIGYEAKTP
jgi:hypothetical protein